MKLHLKLVCLLLTGLASALNMQAQAANCTDVGDERYHQLLMETQDARVFLLELPRLASTQAHCHAHPYFYIVTGDGWSSSTPEGGATISHQWHGAEARFIYNPVKHVVRNEGINMYREVIVESKHRIQYNAWEGNYDTDLLVGDLNATKPTWQISATRGALTATKVQLAPGTSFSMGSPNHVLIAMSDLSLKNKREGMPTTESIELNQQDVHVFRGGQSAELTNAGARAARFIVVEF